MKKLRSILILVLAAAMLLCLTGCGAQNELLGKWEAQIAIGPFFAELIDEVDDIAYELDISADNLPRPGEFMQSIVMPYYLDINSDGTYKLYTDTSTFVGDMKAAMADWIVALYSQLLVEFDIDGSEYGDNDLAIVEAVYEISVEEMVEEMFEDVLSDEDFYSEGKCKVGDGKLWLSAGLDYLPDETMYYTYTLNNGSLTLYDNLGIDEGMEWMYPMSFKSIG